MFIPFMYTILYSKFHRSSVVQDGLTFISKFLGIGPSFHDFNESIILSHAVHNYWAIKLRPRKAYIECNLMFTSSSDDVPNASYI